VSRAVITGAGAVSAFGVGLDALLDGLARGEGAVGPIRSFDASAFPVRVAGEVPVEATTAAWMLPHLPRFGDALARWSAEGTFRDRKVPFALLAAAEAWRRAGCGPACRSAGLSVAFGIEHTFFEDLAALFDGSAVDWRRGEEPGLPRVRVRSRFDLGARVLLEHFGLEGPVAVHASACAGGALAVAHAAALVERGAASIVLCGASDSMLEPFGFGGFCRLGALSLRNTPDACRPFDRSRDGLIMGEGAAMFVVEAEEHARARGARPLATVLGWSSSQDAHRLTAPRPDGAASRRAMEGALRRAGVAPEAVGYVNAHGTGTPLNDVAEARAIRATLGAAAERIPVSSIKGAVGHLMAASGAIELAACLLPLTRDLLPGTAHHRDRDPECDLDIIGGRPRHARVETVLSNSFGFGGQNGCVVLGRSAP